MRFDMYFYCPKCKYESDVDRKDIPKNAVGNIRDGYGKPIYHYQCPQCGNLDAGAIDFDRGDDRLYARSVISMYQNVRGFAK